MIKKEFQYLNRLSKVNSNQGIKFLHHAASPGSHCPMHLALIVASAVQGVSTLVVGMGECGFYSRYVIGQPRGDQGELHYIYELDSNEVVFGARKGIKESLLQIGEEGAKVILIVLTCVPALIGEDIASIIEELKSLTDTKIVFIDGAHYKRNGFQSGMNNVIDQLLRLAEQEPREKKRRVNVFGGVRGEEYKRLKGKLVEGNYEVQEFADRFTFEQLNTCADGTMNIVYDFRMLQAVHNFSKRTGIPMINMASYFQPEQIEENYQRIFRELKLEVSAEEYQKDKEQTEQLCKAVRERYRGENYISTYIRYDALAVAVFLGELGMRPELMHVEEFDESCVPLKNKLMEQELDPYITYITRPGEIVNVMEEPYPSLSLGVCRGMEEEKIILDRDLARMSMMSGFERSGYLLHCLISRKNGRD